MHSDRAYISTEYQYSVHVGMASVDITSIYRYTTQQLAPACCPQYPCRLLSSVAVDVEAYNMPRTDDTCFDSSNSSNVLVCLAAVAILFPGLINLVMLESSFTIRSSD